MKSRFDPDLDSRDFSVEMETGTGKTHVYLRTALELHQAYGFRERILAGWCEERI